MAKFGFVSKNPEELGGPPPWVQKILHAAGKSWKSVGGMSIDFMQCDGHWHMNVTPVLREFAGGGVQDGAQVYAKFSFNLPRFQKAFDRVPRTRFNSGDNGTLSPPELDIRGFVLGTLVYVRVFGGPIPGQPVAEVAYIQGPKEGTVEQRIQDEGSDPLNNVP